MTTIEQEEKRFGELNQRFEEKFGSMALLDAKHILLDAAKAKYADNPKLGILKYVNDELEIQLNGGAIRFTVCDSCKRYGLYKDCPECSYKRIKGMFERLKNEGITDEDDGLPSFPEASLNGKVE